MSAKDSLKAFERYAVPGPGRVLFQAALANFNPHAATRVDFDNDDRAPLLLIVGGADHVVPAAVDRETAKHYAKSSAITDYKEFSGRSHFIVGQTGWGRRLTTRWTGRWSTRAPGVRRRQLRRDRASR